MLKTFVKLKKKRDNPVNEITMKDAVATTENNECVHGNGEVPKNQQTSGAEESASKEKLKGWLNRHLRIKMTDGRVLTGAFLCTDRDANVILGSCLEYLSEEHTEARVLGLVMVPGRHIVSIHLDAWFDEEPATRKKQCSSHSE